MRIPPVTLALLLALVFAVLLFGQSIFQPETAVHEAIEMIGIVLIVIGIAGRLWSTLYIGGRKSASVVSDGPYSITRNPLYVFSAVAAVGVGAQMGSITAAVGFGVACAAAFHLVILREEKYLSANLGADYRAYMAEVPRFFPKPSLYREGETPGFKPSLLLVTLLDGLVFLVAMPFFEIIDTAQVSGALPVLFRIP
jgi:protein-S-isoprenylcysteine O-methyltransferase Ste14